MTDEGSGTGGASRVRDFCPSRKDSIMLATMMAAAERISGRSLMHGNGSDMASRNVAESTDASSVRVRFGWERKSLTIVGEPARR